MIQQIKQSTVKCLHDTDGSDKKYTYLLTYLLSIHPCIY